MAPMTSEIHGPTSHTYFSQRLRLHYVDWGNEDAPDLLLVHGGRDHCRNWDWIAQQLRRDFHIVAPDLRGHGDSQWLYGAHYAMIDYVSDIAQLVDQKHLEPVTIIGHSLGGAITLQYAGIYPDKVRKVVAIEGLGPARRMITDRADTPVDERMQKWIDANRALAGRQPHRYPSLEAAVERLQEANPHLTAEQAQHLTVHGTNQLEDGSYIWKFDNYVRASSPYLFNEEEARAIWSRVTAPTLLVRGSESWAADPEQDGRAAIFPDVQVLTVEGAGHWVHHDRLDVFMQALRAFFAD